MSKLATFYQEKVLSWPGFKVFRYVDFRLLWIGSFLSFTGKQIQNVAQGDFVFDETNSNLLLALVTFSAMIPITLFGPLVAVTSDIWDRRKTLVVTSLIQISATMFLAIAVHYKFIHYWHLVAISLVTGFTVTIEQPTRQAVVRSVVPTEDLASAIPAQGMTFNLARVIGPSIGGVLTAFLGPAICFFINSISSFGILLSAVFVKADLRAPKQEPLPIKDLIFEGMLFTMRHQSLKVLFIMEACTSIFGIFYLVQLPAIAKDLLKLDEKGLGLAYSCVGIGAFIGLITLTSISNRRIKPQIIRLAMTTFSVFMLILSFSHWLPLSFFAAGMLGMCTIAQFNTTNTMFQLISPNRLRGRVLAMHTWAVAGLAPIGTLIFGAIAEKFGLRNALMLGASLVFCGAIYGWFYSYRVIEPKLEDIEAT